MALIRNRKRVAAVLDGGPAAERSATCSSGKKRRIGSDYEEESRLGEGSFGFVVRARHLVTGKIVAIKFLPKDSDVGEMPREACFLEACGGNLNVVGFEDLVRDPTTGDLYLAMEYVGPSLEDFLHHRPPLPEDTVRSFMFQLLTGAKAIQDRQIIHRDIKPANILVTEDGKLVKICDFGLAMSMSEPAPYTQAGTMSYMAPEMLLEKPDYNALVDSWSLGCVMAELLTGNTLFQQPDQSNQKRQLRTIFRVLGVPSGRTWPGFASLPLAGEVREQIRRKKGTGLGHLFPTEILSEDGFEVLQGLLTCNPDKRPTAAAALDLPWFAPPCDMDDADIHPWKEVAASFPAKKALRIKIIPPATTKMMRIKIVLPATPKKNVLRISLATWNKVLHLGDMNRPVCDNLGGRCSGRISWMATATSSPVHDGRMTNDNI